MSSKASNTSNAIQTCPGCDSFILSDTYECPECGHVFDKSKAAAATAAKQARDAEKEKFNALHDPCPSCGEMVRTGLVRCWRCNSFMRQDIAERYQKLTSNPQPIIFSDIPAEQRTEFIPPRPGTRSGGGYGSDVFDAEDDQDDEFTLQGIGSSDGGDREFELDADLHQRSAKSTAEAAKTPPAARTDGPDQPTKQTPGGATADSAKSDGSKSEGGADAATKTAASEKAPAGVDADELLGIALKEQKEAQQRRRNRLAEAKRKRILIPCSCGAWVRVTEEQSGRTVRCRQCKKPVLVPEIRKKEKPAVARKKEAAPEINVDWVEDVHLHVLTPTDLVLKPGSLEKSFEPVDVGFHESGVHIVKLGAAAKGKKKSLFGRGSGGDSSAADQRTEVRAHITKTGGFADVQNAEVMTINAEKATQIRMVQPVSAAHESMFAGVAVFGDGRIAVYLPLDPGESRQAFLSFPLSTFRTFAARLKQTHSVELPAEENGVPAREETETLSCFISQSRVESLKNLSFYQNDPGFQLELSGYKCCACGIAVSEESRAKQKLGGAAGKSIAKAKCPKCSSKFGNLPLYRIVKGAGETEVRPSMPVGGAETDNSAAAEPSAETESESPAAGTIETAASGADSTQPVADAGQS
ncbi:MAG: hypothetical protein R3C19_04865 [Planctomycetaceae bacterium]